MYTEYCCILNPWVNLAVLAPSDILNILNSPENQHPNTMSTSSRAGQWPCWLHLSFGFVAASQIQPILWLGLGPPDRLHPRLKVPSQNPWCIQALSFARWSRKSLFGSWRLRTIVRQAEIPTLLSEIWCKVISKQSSTRHPLTCPPLWCLQLGPHPAPWLAGVRRDLHGIWIGAWSLCMRHWYSIHWLVNSYFVLLLRLVVCEWV